MAAERWGPRYVVLVTSLASAVLTALSPVAANLDYIALVVVRFFLGCAGVSFYLEDLFSFCLVDVSMNYSSLML